MENLTNVTDAVTETDKDKFLFKNFGLTRKFVCNFCNVMCNSKNTLDSHIKIICSNKRKMIREKVHDNSFPNGECISYGDKYSAKPNKVKTSDSESFSKRLRKRPFRSIENQKKFKTRKLRQVVKPVDAPEYKKIEITEEKIAEFKVDGLKIIGNLDNLKDESGKEFKISLYRNVSNGKLQCHLSTESVVINSFDRLNEEVASSHQDCENDSRPLLKCKDCPFRSKNKLSFRRHELIQHVSEKPFKCQTCNYKTTSNGGLKRHVKIHIIRKN